MPATEERGNRSRISIKQSNDIMEKKTHDNKTKIILFWDYCGIDHYNDNQYCFSRWRNISQCYIRV